MSLLSLVLFSKAFEQVSLLYKRYSWVFSVEQNYITPLSEDRNYDDLLKHHINNDPTIFTSNELLSTFPGKHIDIKINIL